MPVFEGELAERAQARIGQVLRGKWRLDKLLGVGGMASVFAGTHRNGKRGAVKLLHLELSANESARARFLREGYVANSVGHPGAVAVLDDDVADDGAVFLVMELLEGTTLQDIAEARPGNRLGIGEVLAIADELLDVLASAHDKGIVHRDLKPDNVFLTSSGAVKVLDFGIARLREASTSGNATRTGESMGTPAYMPPEQALGNWQSVDARTDLWAVGATMFRLLTGRYVHEADTVQKLMLSAMTRPAPPIGSVMPSLPPQVCAILDCALAFDPQQRWPDARSMQQAVRQARTGAPAAQGQRAPAPAPPPAAAAQPTPPIMTAAPVSSDRAQSAPKRSRAGWLAVPALLFVAGAGWLGWRQVQAPDPIDRNEAKLLPAEAAPSPVAATAVAPPSVEPPAPAPEPEPTASTTAPRAIGGRTPNPAPKPSAAIAPSPPTTSAAPASAAPKNFDDRF